MGEARRYRLDDLRRYASAIATGLGVAPRRASALASHLLWFDAVSAFDYGIATLPGLLSLIESGDVDPKAEGRVLSERAATLVYDAERGLPHLALERAAEIAGEKAREVGGGFIRVVNVGRIASAAGVAAGLAVGPLAASLLGLGGGYSVALPGAGGPPTVFDPAFAPPPSPLRGSKRGKSQPAPDEHPMQAALARAFAGEGWVIVALAVTIKDLCEESTRGRAFGLGVPHPADAVLTPEVAEASRREAADSGVFVAPSVWTALKGWADRLGVAPPDPVS